MMHKSAWRYTVTYMKSGQERPYADYVNIVQVRFEHTDHRTGEFTPTVNMVEQGVREMLLVLKCGFAERTRDQNSGSMEDAFKTYLDYLKEVEPGVWEFQTTTRFTD